MRNLRIFCAVALIASLAGSASALSLGGYAGDIKLKFQNWEVGRLYLPGDENDTLVNEGDSFTLTGAELAAAKANASAAGNEWFSVAGDSTIGDEDAWGLFRLQEIQGESSDGVFNVSLYDIDDPSEDVLGMFYGIQDVRVTLTLIDNGGTPGDRSDDIFEQEIYGTGASVSGGEIRFDLYEVPDGSMMLGDPNLRTGLDSYPTFTEPNTPLVSGVAVEGALGVGGPPETSFFSTTRVNLGGDIVNDLLTPGQARMVLNLTGGTGVWLGGSPVVGPFDGSGVEDVFFLTNVFGNATDFNWTTNTDDPAFAQAVIPEPVTIFSVMLGVGGLGRYLRKRRS